MFLWAALLGIMPPPTMHLKQGFYIYNVYFVCSPCVDGTCTQHPQVSGHLKDELRLQKLNMHTAGQLASRESGRKHT
jgi:hypothetical protein